MRRTLKAAIEAALSASGLPAVARRRRRGQTLVIAYHNIVPEGQEAVGDRSLHLPQRAFAQQLDSLCRTHQVVPLHSLPEVSEGVRPRAVITFDDAYHGAMTAGVAELVARGLPATVFVAPAFVGSRSFWWDALAGANGLPSQVREAGLDELQGRDDRIRAWAAARGVGGSEPPAHARCATEDQLARAVSQPGITLGSHSWSHPNLSRLSAPELQEELEHSLRWLETRFPKVERWLAYPYGYYSPAVEKAAEEAGYAGALRVEGGYYRVPGDDAGPDAPAVAAGRFRIPRLNVPSGVSLRGFALRASGFLGR